jgi:hypothetical protein
MEKILAKAMEDTEVMAVILFGSRVRGDATMGSDTDLCLVLCPGEYTGEYLFQKRLGYLALGAGDIHIFSQLPLYIRQRVLKEGRVLLCKDEDQLYEIAFRTAREFEDFRHMYREYLEALLSA